MPKVSVILTTHGEGKYLSQAVASVLAQTYTDFELLVAIDGDYIPVDLDSFKDGSIRELVFRVPNKVSCRFARTINMAFRQSKGEYITYLCHDDLYLPYRLEVMVRVMEELNLDVVFGQQQIIDDTSKFFWGPIRKGDMKNPCGTVDHSSLMHRRECFEKAGGWDEDAPMRYGDSYFWKRLLAAGYVFNELDQVLDVHRFNKESVTWKIDHPEPQDTDPHAPHYFAPYDDMGNVRTINNAVDAGWSAVEGKSREELGLEVGINISQWDEIHK